MKIIIIGAGLGGLAAAIRLTRHDHSVDILEQRSHLSTQGSSIGIRSAATRIFHSWGPDLEAGLREISEETPTVVLRSLKTGEVTMRNIVVDGSVFPDWGTSRRGLIKFLYDKAVQSGARVRFSASVVDVEDDGGCARVKLSDGTELVGALVLAADGIRSQTRSKILADCVGAVGMDNDAEGKNDRKVSIDPIVSTTTFYGSNHATSSIISDEVTKSLADNVNINIWMGQSGYVFSRYNSKLQVWNSFYAIDDRVSDEATTDKSQRRGLWDEHGDLSVPKSFFTPETTCPALVGALTKTESCDRWRLAELPDLPRWTSHPHGRIALLGDSAHAMHPNAAQGFSQIIEDIGVLDLLIERSPTPVDDMARITSTWEKLRKPRAERIRKYARWNTDLFLQQQYQQQQGQPVAKDQSNSKTETIQDRKTNVKSLKDIKPDMHARFNSAEFVKWTLDCDVIAEAEEYLQSHGQSPVAAVSSKL